MIVARNEGLYAMNPKIPVIAKTIIEKTNMKKYLLLTTVLAEIGEA